MGKIYDKLGLSSPKTAKPKYPEVECDQAVEAALKAEGIMHVAQPICVYERSDKLRDTDDAARQLQPMLQGKRLLVMLDDVWRLEQAERLVVEGAAVLSRGRIARRQRNGAEAEETRGEESLFRVGIGPGSWRGTKS